MMMSMLLLLLMQLIMTWGPIVHTSDAVGDADDNDVEDKDHVDDVGGDHDAVDERR
jgi:hypothetical protein